MLTDTIQKQLIEAMKAHDTLKVSVLRMLSSELKNAKIDKGSDLTDEDVVKVIQKEAKKRKDSIEAFSNANREELAEGEKQELEILKAYLPQELSSEEISKYIDDAIAEVKPEGLRDMSRVISAVMAKAEGRADGKVVADLVRSKLA